MVSTYLLKIFKETFRKYKTFIGLRHAPTHLHDQIRGAHPVVKVLVFSFSHLPNFRFGLIICFFKNYSVFSNNPLEWTILSVSQMSYEKLECVYLVYIFDYPYLCEY